MVWQLKLANDTFLFLVLLFQQQLLLSFVLRNLVRRDPYVVQRHDLPVIKGSEAHTKPDLVSTHISPCEGFGLLWLQALLDNTVVPHTRRWVDSEAGSAIPQQLLINGAQRSDL